MKRPASSSIAFLLLSRTDSGRAFTTKPPLSSSSRSTPLSPNPSTTAISALPLLSEATDLYSYALSTYQIPTQCATGGVLCGVGDVVAQKSEQVRCAQRKEAHDVARTKNFVLKGLGGALIWSTWYKVADVLASGICHDLSQWGDWVLTPEFEAVLRTLSCIGLEQFIACPIIFALWDIPVPKLLGGAEPKEIPDEVKKKLPSLLVDNAKLWTFFNVMIYNVPAELRVAASNLCDIVWQVVLSKSLAKEDGTNAVEQTA